MTRAVGFRESLLALLMGLCLVTSAQVCTHVIYCILQEAETCNWEIYDLLRQSTVGVRNDRKVISIHKKVSNCVNMPSFIYLPLSE